jgi:hypothetical protein
MLKLASSSPSAIAMSQKLVCFAELEKQAAQVAGGLSNVVPPSNVRRGDLECHGSFNKLGLEFVQ